MPQLCSQDKLNLQEISYYLKQKKPGHYDGLTLWHFVHFNFLFLSLNRKFLWKYFKHVLTITGILNISAEVFLHELKEVTRVQ